MKIKLRSNSEIARKIAMCFVGSDLECKNSLYKDSYLVATLDDSLGETGFVVRVLYDGCANLAISESITIDLSTAKFDPFVAMREEVYTSPMFDVIGECYAYESVPNRAIFEIEPLCEVGKVELNIEYYRNIEGIEVIE